MRNTNTESTRFYSDAQEKQICKLLGARQTPNSGATKFIKGDLIQAESSLLVECKTQMTDKNSFTIRKEWIDKNKEEAFSQRLSNHAIAFSFGPSSKNYFVIDEELMQFLVSKLKEEE